MIFVEWPVFRVEFPFFQIRYIIIDTFVLAFFICFPFFKQHLMKFLGNLIWLVFGGFIIAIEYLVASLLLMITIIGIPFGFQTLKLASLAIWPFGRQAVYTSASSGCLTTVMNLIWLLIGGIWIALSHVVFGILLAITIIGIPFAMQHFKLAAISLSPFGREIKEIE